MFSDQRYDHMIYRRCGKSGLKLPAVSLGLWHNFGEPTPLTTGRDLLRCAFDLGITHFDLANNYGPPYGAAETTFGKLYRDDFTAHRDELILSSKAGYDMWPGPYGNWGSRKYLIASCDQSLKRMGVDYVDIFYHHRPDPDTPLEETMGALDHIVRSGRALYAGISNYRAADMQKAVAILTDLKTPLLINQIRYHMFDRILEEDVIPAAPDLGSGLIVFSPLAQGVLTERYCQGIPEDSRIRTDGRFLNEQRLDPHQINKVVQLKKIATARQQTMAQLALSWVLRHEAVTSVLIGASKTSQVEDCVGAINNTNFSTDELAAIDSILSA